jgi:hypothetical protein
MFVKYFLKIFKGFVDQAVCEVQRRQQDVHFAVEVEFLCVGEFLVHLLLQVEDGARHELDHGVGVAQTLHACMDDTHARAVNYSYHLNQTGVCVCVCVCQTIVAERWTVQHLNGFELTYFVQHVHGSQFAALNEELSSHPRKQKGQN